MTDVLNFDRIVRSFERDKRVLNGVSFNVAREEIVALLGRNGTGKTTLMQIAMGMLYPDAGTVRLFGLSPTDEPVQVKRRVGFVGEVPMLPMAATIPELIALHKRLFPTWDAQFERELLERFSLGNNQKPLMKMSKGQAQQVALLCAVCHRPELLLLDEPAAGLDPAARREFLETSIQLLNREGTSIVFSSHHMTDVERLGGRVVLLDGGVVRVDEPLDTLRESHSIAVVPTRVVHNRDALTSLRGSLRVRQVHDDWHVVMRAAPEEARAIVAQALNTDSVSARTVPLEELFVELVGGALLEDAA